jgi:hypothetical protein
MTAPMPQSVLKRGLQHTLLTSMLIGSILSIYAAEMSDTVKAVDDAAAHHGLWPVLAISVVAVSMLYAWHLSRRNDDLSNRIITAYEGVLRDAIGSNDDLGQEVRALKSAIRNAPCGHNIPDSDADRAEETPARAARTVARRAARHERNHSDA